MHSAVDPPSLNIRAYAADDQASVRHLNLQTLELARYETDFRSALDLFGFCGTRMTDLRHLGGPGAKEILRASSWRHVAARDSAMTLYHFGKKLEAIGTTCRQNVMLRQSVKLDVIKEANATFNRLFPTFVQVRHAVAHSAESSKDGVSRKRSSFSGHFAEGGIELESIAEAEMTFLNGANLTMNWNGKMLRHEVSSATLERLTEIKEKVFTALADLY